MKHFFILTVITLILSSCGEKVDTDYLMHDELDEALDAVEMLDAM